MIYFILFVSIANLALGFATARLCQRRYGPLSAGQSNFSAEPAQPGGLQDQNTRPSPASASPRAVSPAKAASREQINCSDRQSTGPNSAAWTAPKTWSNLKPEIQSLLDRARYARSAGDKRLAQEMAGQVRDFAQSWCTALQPGQYARGPAENGLLGDQVNAADVEMWMAQLETTLRNLGEMEPTETADAVLDRVERELAALERNSPLAGPA